MKNLVTFLNYNMSKIPKFSLRFEHFKSNLLLKCDNFLLLSHVKAYLHLGIKEAESAEWEVYAISNYDYSFEIEFINGERKKMEYDDYGVFSSFEDWLGIWNMRSKSYIFINHEHKKVVIFNCIVQSLFVDTYKTIRQIIASVNINNGSVPIHCSCVSIGGQGIIFMGDKGSGKTTLVTASLLKYGRLASYLGNDRMLAAVVDNKIRLYSWPTVLGIGPGALHHLNEFANHMNSTIHDKAGGTARWLLDQDLIPENTIPFEEVKNLPIKEKWNWPKKLWITPMEVATACNTNLESETKLELIIFPTLSDEVTEVKVESVSKEDRINYLKNNLLLELPFYPNWLGLPKVSPEILNDSVNKLEKIMENTTSYHVTGGQDTSSVINRIFSLLEHKK